MAGKPVYQHMIEMVMKCIHFINTHSEKKNLEARLYLLVPHNEYKYWKESVIDMGIVIIPGDPDKNMDVLRRFKAMFRMNKPDYIVRLTGDCPFIPSALINKAINCAVNHRLDYVSNVDERYRTMPDGFDVEVMSDKLMLWLSRADVTESDKEHVTTYVRRNFEKWMRVAVITNVMDFSDYKYSIDTKEDFDEVERRFSAKKIKDRAAKSMGYGIYEF